MAESHSDGEIVTSSRPSLFDFKPKYKLNYIDQEEPTELKKTQRSSRRLTRSRPTNKLITLSFALDNPDDYDSDNDSDWLPPQHPKSKSRRKIRRKMKPKEERWSFWKKQLPKHMEYSKEEIRYFMKQTLDTKKHIIKDETLLYQNSDSEIPIRFKFLNMKSLSPHIRLMIINKIDAWLSMDDTNSDMGKMSNWIDGLNKIPFETYTPSVRTIVEQQKLDIVTYMKTIKQHMDNAVYAHEQAKEQILELVARDYCHPHDKYASGFCVGLQGPPGNGKTSLIKEGISKSLNRPFHLISLGGAKDSSTLVGHNYTYEGSSYGGIMQILRMSKVMNPIIYFDELDKLSETTKGEEIANLLCHITDPSQNTLFEDKYFAGIPIDLSKVMFIFSFNDESKINPILRDRIQIIRTDALQIKEKIIIVKNYILPEVSRELPSLPPLIWSDQVITHIIANFTNKEKGVRNLRRAIFSICRKINLHMVLNGSGVKLHTKFVEPSGSRGEITVDMVEEYLKSYNQSQITTQHMYL